MTAMPAPASSRTIVQVDLSDPCRVGEHAARYQSVWLLARIWLAASRDHEDLGAAAVRARFADAANVRMIVSRAFGDFARWGIPVGWGHDKGMGISALRADGRSRGPFWMSAATAGRVRFSAHGKPLGAAGVARWLGRVPAGDTAPAPDAGSEGLQYVMRDMAFWRHLTQAMRGAQDGFAGVLDHGVAESFRAAQRTAADDFQQALSLLKESLAWRRSDRLDKSRAALRRFERIVVAGGVNAALPTFAAMAHVVRGWEHYARGELDAAQRELARLSGDAELRPVVRYNPRIRFETLNLEALVHKSIALRPDDPDRPAGAQASPSQRQEAARLALDAFAGALQAAYEADSVDAVQHAAANIGWSLWLFWLYRLVDVARDMAPGDVQRQAMRWLGLSEWICDRFGVGGGSAWNTIFLLRVARGSVSAGPPASLAAFRARQPLSVAAAIDALRPFHAPFAPAKGFVRWSSVAAFALEEHDTGRVAYNALQLANLLLESAWYLTHEQGATAQAYDAMERLATQLGALRAAERGFFHSEIRAFPPELRAAAAEAAAWQRRPRRQT
ncbi:hypothetical protein [Cupriavidus sp. D384]|uniref:hypothetical protein n=1 Tax=Cupriavidus sp. D384 TaxID=1538095 RepID=UPI00082BF3FB|nr:hypothetical protein [Cupriavidus sp. D384]